ncbi:MAG: hypothetical protein M3367_02885 [Acidobacteriota bacterium]|nr:hypothetical protein [Acidobacteriota bacterium]
MAAENHLVINKGYTYTLICYYTNPDGSAVNLTGKSIVFNLKKGMTILAITSGTPTALGSTVILTPLGGRAEITLSKEETNTFEQVPGQWSTDLIDGAKKFLLDEGTTVLRIVNI